MGMMRSQDSTGTRKEMGFHKERPNGEIRNTSSHAGGSPKPLVGPQVPLLSPSEHATLHVTREISFVTSRVPGAFSVTPHHACGIDAKGWPGAAGLGKWNCCGE